MGNAKWFDSHGNLLRPIPAETVSDCSSVGDVSESVTAWCNALRFEVPREAAIRYLSEFGAWPIDSDEYDTGLADMSDEDIAEKVLWVACCDIRENGGWYGLNV